MKQKIKIGMVDDHKLFLDAIATSVTIPKKDRDFEYEIVFKAQNGRDMIEQLFVYDDPDLILLDINMPEMDGFESLAWLNEHKPKIKVLMVTMHSREEMIVRAIKLGACGYALKNVSSHELLNAIDSVFIKGYYYSEDITNTMAFAIKNEVGSKGEISPVILSEREMIFLKYATSELTYREIAEKMSLSPRSIDGIRDALFDKLNVKTRIGLVLFALRNVIVEL